MSRHLRPDRRQRRRDKAAANAALAEMSGARYLCGHRHITREHAARCPLIPGHRRDVDVVCFCGHLAREHTPNPEAFGVGVCDYGDACDCIGFMESHSIGEA